MRLKGNSLLKSLLFTRSNEIFLFPIWFMSSPLTADPLTVAANALVGTFNMSDAT